MDLRVDIADLIGGHSQILLELRGFMPNRKAATKAAQISRVGNPQLFHPLFLLVPVFLDLVLHVYEIVAELVDFLGLHVDFLKLRNDFFLKGEDFLVVLNFRVRIQIKKLTLQQNVLL